jgi:membrane protein implicated in regulation of membrane protease activity
VLLVVALVLLFVLPDPWNVVVGAVCAALGVVEIYAWNTSVRRRKKVVGAQTLVGQTAEVREACRPVGQVFVAGELWAARCDEEADVGARVRVAAVRGLMLEVTAEP